MTATDKIALFGAGIDGRRALDYFGSERVLFFIDNNPSKTGKKIAGIDIISFDDFVQRGCDCQVVITVDIRFIHAVARQLEDHGFYDYISFYEIRNGLRKSDLLYLMYRENDLDARFSWLLDRCDIKDLKPATGYLRKKQMDILAFCKKFLADISVLDIHPFLDGGNLIGAIRHGGFVPWDDDLDFGIMRDDYEKLLEYAKEHYIVKINRGRISQYDNDAHMSWVDQIIRENPEQYVFDIQTDMMQIDYGTSCIDRLSLDFFVYDYYDNDYTVEEHRGYLRSIIAKKTEIDYVDKIVEYLADERARNPRICDHPTEYVFPGIDNETGTSRVDSFKKLLRREDFFPFQKIRFEDDHFFAPNHIDAFLEFEYPGYMDYPEDVGRTSHFMFREKYMSFYLPSVDFYIDCPENVSFFEQIFDFFEHNEVYSRFLIIKKEYTDIDKIAELIDILEAHRVRYYASVYSDSDLVLFANTIDASFERKNEMELNGKIPDQSGMMKIKDEIIKQFNLKRRLMKYDD